MTSGLDLTGRVALVTGASSGLGRHFGRILAGAGAKVALAARRTTSLESLREDIVAAGGTAVAVALDVANEQAVIAAYDAVEAALGPVDTIIANAGINRPGAATDLPTEAVDEMIDVNLRGVFLTVREGARRLIASGSAEHGRGRVVITASIAATAVDPGLAIYSATKAGVLQMGRVLARDWIRKGINVNMLCPGYIRTGINADWFDSEGGARQIQSMPRRRIMQARDLDIPLLYLASDASAAVTGSAFTIDDGQSL